MSEFRQRSLEQARDELVAKLKKLPLNHPGRGDLTRQIVGLEDEIDRRASNGKST